ncbi:cytochrome b/b6 domain-containing protein [Thiohalobacter sp. COW1]|uniref:cytochrome b/b6 domain-containing protein n=1 Tax=Thiohalobacter sp. COW1 TaxID=2795687 RepID=UPI00210485DC|nr:cytochrome b/b6 domain-containing protein [Thiohalobacter sp. COW1]
MAQPETKTYRVWDRSVRVFHWVNFSAVLLLLTIGLIIYNNKALGISAEAKVFLKTFHVWVGYVLALNLAWRYLWGFVGSRYGRWATVLSFGRGYFSELGAYLRSLVSAEPRRYLGHNPLGRLMVLVLFVLLTVQAATGLVLAGTDIYYPPLGGWIAGWVAATGVDPATLVPGDKALVDPAAWEAMRGFRKPYITLHKWVFFVLSGAALLHVLAVVVLEIRSRSGLVSVMIHGYKTPDRKPEDRPE